MHKHPRIDTHTHTLFRNIILFRTELQGAWIVSGNRATNNNAVIAIVQKNNEALNRSISINEALKTTAY